MLKDFLGIRLGGELTIDKMSDVFARFTTLLDTLGKTHNANIRWVLAGLEYGSAAVIAKIVPIDTKSAQCIPAMYRNSIQTASQIAKGNGNHTDPPYPIGSGKPIAQNRAKNHSNRTDPLYDAMRELAKLVSVENPITFATPIDSVVLTNPLEDADSESSEPHTISLGTVRGRVETLTRRRGLSFSLYELATDRAVVCYIDKQLEDKVRSAWGHIADVTGTISRDAYTGRPLRIRRVLSVDVIEEGKPDDYMRARGAITLTEPAEIVIRRMRNDRWYS